LDLPAAVFTAPRGRIAWGSTGEELQECVDAESGRPAEVAIAVPGVARSTNQSFRKREGTEKSGSGPEPTHRGYPNWGSGFGSAFCGPRGDTSCLQTVYRKTMKRHTEIVSFRADQPLLKRIDEARKPLVLSRGDWTREVIITRFHEIEDAIQVPDLANSLLQFDERLDQRLERVEANQRRSLVIVLTQLGVPLDQAKQIARGKLSS
jgi:hypothetical protein